MTPKMSFVGVLHYARAKNGTAPREEPGTFYNTRYSPPKKAKKEKKEPSKNIQKFLEKREAEDERRERDRSVSVNNKTRKVQNSVLEDEEHCDLPADDYGFVSTESNDYHQQYLAKVKHVQVDKGFVPIEPQVLRDLTGAKERVKAALTRDIRPKSIKPTARKSRERAKAINKKPVAQRFQSVQPLATNTRGKSVINKPQTERFMSVPPVANKTTAINANYMREVERRQQEAKKKPNVKPFLSFEEQLRLADMKPVKKEPERLLTARQKKKELEKRQREKEEQAKADPKSEAENKSKDKDKDEGKTEGKTEDQAQDPDKVAFNCVLSAQKSTKSIGRIPKLNKTAPAAPTAPTAVDLAFPATVNDSKVKKTSRKRGASTAPAVNESKVKTCLKRGASTAPAINESKVKTCLKRGASTAPAINESKVKTCLKRGASTAPAINESKVKTCLKRGASTAPAAVPPAKGGRKRKAEGKTEDKLKDQGKGQGKNKGKDVAFDVLPEQLRTKSIGRIPKLKTAAPTEPAAPAAVGLAVPLTANESKAKPSLKRSASTVPIGGSNAKIKATTKTVDKRQASVKPTLTKALSDESSYKADVKIEIRSPYVTRNKTRAARELSRKQPAVAPNDEQRSSGRKAATSKDAPRKRDISAKGKKKGRIYDNSDSEHDSELDDFIEKDDSKVDVSSHIRNIFGYDRRKYRDQDEDDAQMESNFAQVQREEFISKKLGMQEDLEDMRKEALKKKDKIAKKRTKRNKRDK